jgi:tight adherence protein C
MTMDFPILISLLAFVMVLLTSLAVYVYLNSREASKVWRRRVEGQTGTYDAFEPDAGWADSIRRQLSKLLQTLGKSNQPTDQAEILNLRQGLITAGYRSAHAPIVFLGAKLLCAMVTLLSLVLIPHKWLGFPSTTNLIVFYVLAAGAGYYAPVLWLRSAIGQRKQTIMRALPDALDLMVVCVEAGLGLDQAINRVADEIKLSHQELSEEFHLLGLELRAGVARTDALRNLSRRIDLEEIKSLIALLVQTDRFGTSIGQALRVHSEGMKVSRQMKAEERAAKIPVKLLLPLILFIFPSVFIAIMGPGAIRIIRTLLPGLGQH